MELNKIYNESNLETMARMPDNFLHCVVTSPPYWGLRDYGTDGTPWPAVSYQPLPGMPEVHIPEQVAQLGLEETPEAFVGHIVHIFREVRRVLREDGTLWLNFGDSYAGGKQGRGDGGDDGGNFNGQPKHEETKPIQRKPPNSLKPKDLCGIPWRVAFALQADGWWLRQDIIWCISGGTWLYVKSHKGEMPMMVKDMVRLDPSTIQLWNGKKWTQVLGWGKNKTPGDKIELVLRSGERIGCTGEHLWPTQRGNVRADQLQVGDTIKTCQLPEPENTNIPHYITPEMLWFIGLYLAEGSRSGDKIQISGHAKELNRWTTVQSVAAHFGGSAARTVDGNKMDIRVYSRILNAVIDEYISGRTAKDKGLKVKAWALPNWALKIIAEGYLSGDGYDDKDNGRYRLGFCRNYNLERDLRTLASRLGATLTLNPTFATNGTSRFPSFRGEWRWIRSGHHNEKNRGEIMEIRRSRARCFWDISVADAPNLFSLSSGVLTHNCKPNPMPESVTDRCTKAHEYVFLLTKSSRYYYDAEAVKQPVAPSTEGRGKVDFGGAKGREYTPDKADPNYRNGSEQWGRTFDYKESCKTGRNRRSVWTIATQPYSGAHFAVFPPALVKPCVLAGSPQKVCSECGAGWVREVERKSNPRRKEGLYKSDYRANVNRSKGQGSGPGSGALTPIIKTLGWRPSCTCNAEPGRAIVYDPFGGSGTTAEVANEYGRDWIVSEISEEYVRECTRPRLEKTKQKTLF